MHIVSVGSWGDGAQKCYLSWLRIAREAWYGARRTVDMGFQNSEWKLEIPRTRTEELPVLPILMHRIWQRRTSFLCVRDLGPAVFSSF